MELSFYYCLFMLTCFGAERKDIVPQLSCPSSCNCYHASGDGIGSQEAESFVCRDLEFLRTPSFNTKLINTFVLKNGQFEKGDYKVNKKYQTLSLVLEQFASIQQLNAKYIFDIIDQKTLRYLTIVNSSFESIEPKAVLDWSSLATFEALQVIYIESCFLPKLGESFASLTLNELHTLTIKSSLLDCIDRDALNGKWNLRKLDISDNAIRNWNWLTSLKRPLAQLWHLDLSSNHLTTIPVDLKSVLPNLRVFYLAHNRLRYFSHDAMLPWFSINEFQPAMIKPKKDPNDKLPDLLNYIYYNADLETIIQEAVDNKIQAQFMIDSLVNQILFVCGPEAGTASWRDIEFCGNYIGDMNTFPDNFQINTNGQLQKFKENGDSDATKILIEGIDFQKSPISSNSETFYFDSTINVQTYRRNRDQLISQLDSLYVIPSYNAIRLNLFSKTTLNYFLGEGPMDIERIELIIDLVDEILDEANERQIYVMLIMWNYDKDLAEAVKDSNYLEVSGQLFENTVIAPLMKRISAHPALIGIEVINQFLSDDAAVLANQNGVQFDRCDPSYLSSVMPQMLFLGYNADALKKHSNDKLIGLSIGSTCKDCLQLSLIQSCRKIQQFEHENGFDFITFVTSDTATVTDQPYHYSRWKASDFTWFHQTDKNSVNVVGSNPRAVFFVLSDTINDPTFAKSIDSVGSGYFIANRHTTPTRKF